MKELMVIAVVAVFLFACATTSGPGSWQTIKENAQMLQIKNIDGYGMDYDYTGENIGLADSIVASFSSIGPTQRKTVPTTMQGPLIRLRGASLSPLDTVTNELIAKAIKINAEPSMIDSRLWQRIKEKYPSMTHVITTIFQVAEEWRISGDSTRIPYLWSSYVIARTVVIDINTRQIVSEWRQEVQDRSTWTRAPEAPERLVYYFKPVETTQNEAEAKSKYGKY